MGTVRSYLYVSNPAVPPVITTLHTACVTCGSTLLCTLYRETIGEIQLVQELLIWPVCLSSAVNFFLSIKLIPGGHRIISCGSPGPSMITVAPPPPVPPTSTETPPPPLPHHSATAVPSRRRPAGPLTSEPCSSKRSKRGGGLR